MALKTGMRMWYMESVVLGGGLFHKLETNGVA
jgi:hypothetical protein